MQGIPLWLILQDELQKATNQIQNYLMCGNEISSVTSPSADFHALVNSQLPTRKLALKNYPINANHTLQLHTINLSTLKELSLDKCRVNHQTLDQLSRLHMPQLGRLSLNDNQVGPIGCRVLAGSPLMSRLTELALNNNKIRDVGVKALAGADLEVLEDLSLSDNGITGDGLTALQGKLGSLECLSLGGNKLNDKAVAQLKQLNPSQKVYLKLSRNEITDEGLKDLLGTFRNLSVLLVDRNRIKQGKEKQKVPAGLFLFY